MKTSKNGLEFIKRWEGCVLHQYICPAGKPTIGIGHVVLPGEKFPTVLTEQEALDLLDKDVMRFEEAIEKNIKVGLNQNQFDALVSFTFNVGTGGVIGSGLQRELNAGKYDAVPGEMLKWCKFVQNGVKKVNVGLQNRRKAEGELFMKPSTAGHIVTTTKQLLQVVQTKLKAVGLNPGPIDGIWGPKTEMAVKLYEKRCFLSAGKDPSISISQDFLDHLMRN